MNNINLINQDNNIEIINPVNIVIEPKYQPIKVSAGIEIINTSAIESWNVRAILNSAYMQLPSIDTIDGGEW